MSDIQKDLTAVDYSTNRFLEKIYEDSRPKENLRDCLTEEMESCRERLLHDLENCLCIRRMDSAYGCQLTYKKETTFQEFDVDIHKYTLSAISDMPFPVYVLEPEKPNGMQVLYCHGHDDLGIMGALLERHDKIRYHKNLPILLAKAGFTVVAPEFAGFGESDYLNFPEGKRPKGGCMAHTAYLTMAGYSIAGLRVLQALKTLDFMDATGLGGTIYGFGVSGGGMICQYLGVLDQRVKGMAISSYVSPFRTSVLHQEHCVDNYTPGILQVGESHEILAAFAPRPLLTINGAYDRAFPVAGSNQAFPFLEAVYKRTGGDYTGIIFQGKHEIDQEEVLNWFAGQVQS